jgi:hypothetical protein
MNIIVWADDNVDVIIWLDYIIDFTFFLTLL